MVGDKVKCQTLRHGGNISNYGKPLFGIQRAVEEGIFEKHRCTFYDLRIKASVTMAEALKTCLIHGNRSRIINPETDKFISLSDAVEKGIVSGKTGSILDRRNMKSVPLEKAVDENLVVDVPFSRVTLDEAVMYGLLNVNTLKMQSVISDERVSLSDSLLKGLVDVEETLVKDPDNDTTMTLKKAVDCGLFNTTTACIVCDSGRIICLADSLQQGYILNGRSLCNFSRLPRVRKHTLQVDENSATTDIVSKQPKHSSDSSGIGIPQCSTSGSDDICDSIEGNVSEMSSVLTFGDALRKNLIDTSNRGVMLPYSGDVIPITKAIEQGSLDVSAITFQDPVTNENWSFNMAVDRGLLDLSSENKISSENVSRKGISFEEAISKGFLIEKTQACGSDINIEFKKSSLDQLMVNKPTDIPKSSHNLSASLDSLLQVVRDDKGTYRLGTLYRILVKGMIKSDDWTMEDTFTGKHFTLQDAMQNNLINVRAREVRNLRTHEVLSLQDAVSLRIIDPVKATYFNVILVWRL